MVEATWYAEQETALKALQLLEQVATREMIPRLVLLLTELHPNLRKQAEHVLWKYDHRHRRGRPCSSMPELSELIPSLVLQLSNFTNPSDFGANQVLENIDKEWWTSKEARLAIPRLLELLPLRPGAAYMVVKLKSEEALVPLRQLLVDSRERVTEAVFREAAHVYLSLSGTAPDGIALETFAQALGYGVGRLSEIGLASLGPLLAIVRDSAVKSEVRASAANGLEWLLTKSSADIDDRVLTELAGVRFQNQEKFTVSYKKPAVYSRDDDASGERRLLQRATYKDVSRTQSVDAGLRVRALATRELERRRAKQA